jgi:hypothetical protein
VTESIALPPDAKGHCIMSTFSQGAMSKVCEALTMLAQITRGPSGFDIRTFECPACNRVYQRVVALGDPMKSPETAGWLRGELRAPT